MTIRSVIVEFWVVDRPDGAFLCKRSNCLLPSSTTRHPQYSTLQCKEGTNVTQQYIWQGDWQKIFGSQVSSTMLCNSRLEYTKRHPQKMKCRVNEVTVEDRNRGGRERKELNVCMTFTRHTAPKVKCADTSRQRSPHILTHWGRGF